ncbi:MAG: hypothetical protein N4A63_07470 [Vallitalea sp.]|jgi:hypothetical protein|nr:hypothetical protein [Vallitalea sp.]
MKKLLKKFFSYMEKSYVKKHNLILVPGTEYGYVYIDIHNYKGEDVTLSDGTIVTKGDTVAEIHINNSRIEEVSIKKVIKVFTSEMHAMARTLKNNDEYKDIKAVYGRTVLYPLTKRLGFDTFEVKTKRTFIKIWDNLIRVAFSSSKNDKKMFREPKEVWISSTTIMKTLGDK